MLKSIKLNNKEFFIIKKNLAVFGKSDLMEAIKSAIHDHNPNTPLTLTMVFDEGVLLYNYKNPSDKRKYLSGDVLKVSDYLIDGTIIFEDTSIVDLHEIMFSDCKLVIDLFDEIELQENEKPPFFNFVQELSTFLGDKLTDYNKALTPMRKANNKYCIGCLDYDTYEVSPLNQEPERIKHAIKFICNTLKINNHTKLVFIDNLNTRDFKLDCYALVSDLDDDSIQYIYIGKEPLSIQNTTKYILKEK